jgi:gliding motility-associated-like protein
LKRLTLIIAALFILGAVTAQIIAPGSRAVRATNYPGGHTPIDSVYIFCSSETAAVTLEADAPGGFPPYDFVWHRWSTADNDFTELVHSEMAAARSLLSGAGEGGYRVTITGGGGYDTSLIAWIHLATPHAGASLLDRRCNWVALQGVAAADTFYYYQPLTGQPVLLPAGRTFAWSSDPESVIPFPTIELNPVTYTPPLEDVTYKLQVTDSYGCVAGSSFFYESIHVKAEFDVEPVRGEAPLEIAITDNSIRALKYTWHFGDDTVSTLPGDQTHIYYRPGSYNIKLIIESELLCVDSITSPVIEVDPSSLNIPNVFTPNGDGANDFFKPETTSLRMIDMQIFSRTGTLVYSFRGEGDRLKDWQGWDGTVNNSSRNASPGIYYYVIRARGWDDIFYETKEHRGFLYLFR